MRRPRQSATSSSAASAAMLGGAIGPAIANYVRDTPDRIARNFGPDPNAPDPLTNLAAAASNPAGVERAVNIAMGTGVGAIKAACQRRVDFPHLWPK